MMKHSPFTRSVPVIAGILLAALPASSVVLDTVLDRQLVQHAELIFIGTVTAIDYKLSDPNPEEDAGIPHTFVTFSVEQILKGSLASQGSLTLRLQGGLDVDETYMRVSGVPVFDIGDQDILFVRRNGEALCPLVGWKRGTFRMMGEEVYNNLGYDLILSEDPILAARIHPRDIRNYRLFAETLTQGTTAIDRTIQENLSDETRTILANPDLISTIDPRKLSYHIPEEYLAEFENEVPPGELARRLIPRVARGLPRDFVQALLFRDLNALLLRRELFSARDLVGITLRPQTQQLLLGNPAQMTVGQVLLRNRRILEDAYPRLLIRSPDRTAVGGDFHMIPEIMQFTVGDHVLEMVMRDPEDDEGSQPDREPAPTGTRMTVGMFLEHIRGIGRIQEVPGENIPPVASADIAASFVVPSLTPTRFAIDHDVPRQEPSTPRGQEERLLLEASGGNPVLTRQ